MTAKKKIHPLWRLLTVHSGRELIRYKSFFLLILGLIALDRAVHHWLPARRPDLHLPGLSRVTRQTAAYIFEQLPEQLFAWLLDGRAIAVIAVLFLLKQLISLWPSSDMRRMHRFERDRFGVLSALAAIRWQQVVWDAAAVSTIVGLLGVWTGVVYSMTRFGWQQFGHPFWLFLLAGLVGLGLPLGMAGFSYSSKLAVLSRGSFAEKRRLFFMLFTDWRVFWTSWLFFLVRIFLEAMFVAAIPAGAILFIDQFWLRILLAAVSATPVYAFLKMASFKFFLFTYDRFPLVRQEYQRYFNHPSDEGYPPPSA